MRNNYLFFIFTFILAFIQAPKPENIRIFNVDDYYNKEGFYDIVAFKNEIFGLEFKRGRGTNCYWGYSNETFLKESNFVRFLNSSTWDYISEQYQKELEAAKNSNNHYIPSPILGGSENYYELFKALDGGNQSQTLYFTYSCGGDIYKKADVAIWIVMKFHKPYNYIKINA